ncbi:hypothetical protein KIN34_12040 [Cellulomonas sp. DKR-3]|uniref:AbiEi antitoxin C-terminal domain-containing protein n=1 Tax=Cellulomonas fulva TaxID=2835530 RepID=A0ABS5U0T3_9CELL|nr:hypothetical protein [Cellulomonas fulva]MBT0995011.1 hypothetical protein [Cellulomonas fulva]
MPHAPSLLPRPRELARLVRREDVGAAAWTGMLRDGVLTVVRQDVATVGPVPPGAPDRARALEPLLPRHGVVGRDAAAWVHTGTLEPLRACVLVPCGVRRPNAQPGRTCAEADLPPDDVLRLGAVPVTTIERTAVDVARWLEPDRAVDVLVGLVVAGLDLDDTCRRLDALAGRRNLRAAREVLRRTADRVSGPPAPPSAHP